MKQFGFDCRLNAVVRVTAVNEDAARKLASEVLDCCEPDDNFLTGYNSKMDEGVRITELSLSHDWQELDLIDDDAIADDNYRDAAREHWAEDGKIEIDGEALVSPSADGGAYVQAWLWIGDDKAKASE